MLLCLLDNKYGHYRLRERTFFSMLCFLEKGNGSTNFGRTRSALPSIFILFTKNIKYEEYAERRHLSLLRGIMWL